MATIVKGVDYSNNISVSDTDEISPTGAEIVFLSIDGSRSGLDVRSTEKLIDLLQLALKYHR